MAAAFADPFGERRNDDFIDRIELEKLFSRCVSSLISRRFYRQLAFYLILSRANKTICMFSRPRCTSTTSPCALTRRPSSLSSFTRR